jgi:crotonobetainyl-CoA:carnitine CoA-transferase CaiB-like acyl-CoA transferase
LLGDLGADVIKVERREHGDRLRGIAEVYGTSQSLPGGRHVLFEHHNRNKRGITLDVSKPRGLEIMHRLVEKSDIFISNLIKSPESSEMGLDYLTLSKLNPGLIYVRGTTFGDKGPLTNLPGVDLLGQATSGIMAASGEPGMPPITIPWGIADQTTSLALAFGSLAALIDRERTGVGQEVDASLLGSMVFLQASPLVPMLLCKFEPGVEPFHKHDRKRAHNPLYNYYRCKDGQWIALTNPWSQNVWPSFCQAIGSPELEEDARFIDADRRKENGEELIAILDATFLQKTRPQWEELLRNRVLVGPVNNITDLPSDPQVLENQYITTYDHPELGKIRFPWWPLHFSKTPPRIERPAPQFGQHTEEVLMEICGYGWDDIEEFKRQEVI